MRAVPPTVLTSYDVNSAFHLCPVDWCRIIAFHDKTGEEGNTVRIYAFVLYADVRHGDKIISLLRGLISCHVTAFDFIEPHDQTIFGPRIELTVKLMSTDFTTINASNFCKDAAHSGLARTSER